MAQQTFSGVPGDFTAGQVLTAADMDKLREFLLYLIKDGDEGDTGEVSPVIMDLGNDRVGINTDAPTTTLHVVGKLRAEEGGDGGYKLGAWASGGGFAALTTNGMAGNEYALISDGTNVFVGSGTDGTTFIRGAANAGGHELQIQSATAQFSGDLYVVGALSKGSGSFDIAHPTKGGDWRLRHSFIEGPQADLIYRGTVTLAAGSATVDLDTASNMTAGTWEALCRDPWTMVASSGNAVEWSLSGKILTITGPADAVCNWMVIAERQDDHMKSAEGSLADDDGYIIVEYEGLRPLPDPTAGL